MMNKIETNVHRIRETIERACKASKRAVGDVTPIVVSKNRTLAEIQEMYRLGFRHFAENRVEKLLERQQEMPQQDIVWHLIGPLQRRKVKQIINEIHYFHALDRLEVAEEIEKRATKSISCFVEVNVSEEATKHGFKWCEVDSVVKQLQQFSHIQIVGFMTMAPIDASDEEITRYFHQLKQLAEHVNMPQALLSMGMSQDYELAIQEGATHIRIGTAWFE